MEFDFIVIIIIIIIVVCSLFASLNTGIEEGTKQLEKPDS